VVTFERQLYWAQAVASLVGDILEVKASVVNSQAAVTYSLSAVGKLIFQKKAKLSTLHFHK